MIAKYNTLPDSSFDLEESNPVILNSIEEGLASRNFNLSTVKASCSTGNCSWVEYSSLGVCTSVSDISSTINHNACNLTAFEEYFDLSGFANPGYSCFNYTLPEQAFVPLANGISFRTANATLTNAFTDVGFIPPPMGILSLNSIYNDFPSTSVYTAYLMYQPDFATSINSTLPSPVAYELDLHLCVQIYNTTVSNGVTNTTMLSSQIIETGIEQNYDPSSDTTHYTANNSHISIEGNTFDISNYSLIILSQTMSALSTMCYGLLNDPQQPLFCDNNGEYAFLDVLVNSTDPLSEVTQHWENMAISITNTEVLKLPRMYLLLPVDDTKLTKILFRFRTGAGGDTQIGHFEGTAFAPIAFVEINYLWLILPITLIVLTLVFLLATISKSQHLGNRVWKSSNLATLQGLNGELHTKLGGLSSISEMEEKTKEVEMKFNLDLRFGKTGHNVEYRLVESKQEAYWRG